MMDGWHLVALLLGWGSQAAHAWRLDKQDQRELAKKQASHAQLRETVRRLERELGEAATRVVKCEAIIKALHSEEQILAALDEIL